MPVVVQLGGDEHLITGQAGFRDGLADTLLVAVTLGGVDVPVAGLEGLQHGLRGLIRWDLEDPEAELRDVNAVVQSDVGYLNHASNLPVITGSCYAQRGPPRASDFDHHQPTQPTARPTRC